MCLVNVFVSLSKKYKNRFLGLFLFLVPPEAIRINCLILIPNFRLTMCEARQVVKKFGSPRLKFSSENLVWAPPRVIFCQLQKITCSDVLTQIFNDIRFL